MKEVARTLYYASIALALTQIQMRITHLSDPERLAGGFEWCVTRSWMDANLRTIFSEAVAWLAQRGDGTSRS